MTEAQKQIINETEKIYFDEGCSWNKALEKAKEVICNENLSQMEKAN